MSTRANVLDFDTATSDCPLFHAGAWGGSHTSPCTINGATVTTKMVCSTVTSNKRRRMNNGSRSTLPSTSAHRSSCTWSKDRGATTSTSAYVGCTSAERAALRVALAEYGPRVSARANSMSTITVVRRRCSGGGAAIGGERI